MDLAWILPSGFVFCGFFFFFMGHSHLDSPVADVLRFTYIWVMMFMSTSISRRLLRLVQAGGLIEIGSLNSDMK
jgi:drug/metabolite transporter (DMT)-like permease